jgi:hypothetical protein
MTIQSMPVSSGGRRRLAPTEMWDPGSTIFDAAAIESLVTELAELRHQVEVRRTHLEEQGPTAQLIRKSESVDVPPGWLQSPGSPVYYLRAAESFLNAAAEGTVCRDQHPPSPRAHRPPPGDRWCCSHGPQPHCEP